MKSYIFFLEDMTLEQNLKENLMPSPGRLATPRHLAHTRLLVRVLLIICVYAAF